MSFLKRLFVTYTKRNKETGEVYSGLASGQVEQNSADLESIQEILRKRDSSHHKNKEGFGEAQPDQYSESYEAIRGREQMLIDYNGGSKSEGGSSGNEINSISRRNKKRNQYLDAAIKLFGGLSILFVIILFLRILD